MRGQRTGATEVTGRSAAYGYDENARLVSETITNAGSGLNGAVGYTLDPVGNRLTRTSTLPVLGPQTFSYDGNDQLTSDAYDLNGNTTSSDGNTYTYDSQNRLVSKTGPGGTVTLVYDCDGNRVAKTAGGVTTKYLVDDLNPTGYLQVLEELQSGVVQTRYVYGMAVVSQTRDVGVMPVTSYYGYDAHGSVAFLTDASGAITDTYDYDAWGNIVAQTGSTPNTRMYVGEDFDADMGLINLRARQYSAGTGRFWTIDPVDVIANAAPRDPRVRSAIALIRQPHLRALFEAAAPDGALLGARAFMPMVLDRYLYASADPVNLVDPSGRLTVLETAVLASGVFLAVHGAVAQFSKGKFLQCTGDVNALADVAAAVTAIFAPELTILEALLDVTLSLSACGPEGQR
jgi:RHS repeat-associated protein